MANQWAIVFTASACLGLGACESVSIFGSEAPAWPGANQAAYDEMQETTQCRPTLGAPDCRVMAVRAAGAPQDLGQPAN